MKLNVFANIFMIGLEKLLQFLLIYIILGNYSEKDFSIYVEYISIVLVLSVLYGAGTGVYLKELYSKYEGNYDECFFDVTKLLLISTLFISFFSFVILKSSFFSLPDELHVILILQSIVTAYSATCNIKNILDSSLKKRGTYLNFVPSIMLLLLVAFEFDIKELVQAQLVLSFVTLIYISPSFVLKTSGKVSFKGALKYLPHSLSMYVIINSDRLMVSVLSTDYELVKYTLATQLTNLLNLIPVLFEVVLVKFILMSDNRFDKKIFIIKLLALPFFLILSFILGYLFDFIYPDYSSGINYIIHLNSIAMSFMFIYMLNVNKQISTGNGGHVVIFSFTFAIVNLVLNYFFIPKFGALAASSSTLIIYALMALCTISRRKKD